MTNYLVLKGLDADIDIPRLGALIEMEAKKNSLPDEGIAIIDCGSEVPEMWNWADTIIRAGTCEMGRHRFDVSIEPGQDVMAQLIELIRAQEDTVDEGTEDTGL